MGGPIKSSVLSVIVACVLVCAAGVSSASASSAWWHLGSTTRPTYLHPGQGKDEAWQLTVDASEGLYVVDGREEKFKILRVDESPREVQGVIEEMYGLAPGEVEVDGGPGAQPGIEYGTYEIRFMGELADRRVEPFTISIANLRLHEEEEPPTGTAVVTELTKGRPDGEILVTATNLGDEYANPVTDPIVVSDKLPAGVEAIGIEGEADEGFDKRKSPLTCALGPMTCTFTGAGPNKLVAPYNQIQVRIAVELNASAKSGEVNEAKISGGSVPGAAAKGSLVISGAPIPFGVNDYEMRPEEEGGGVDTQAGSHPFQLTTTILFNETFEGQPLALAKDLHFKLPMGLIGNPTPFAQCQLPDFLKEGSCPAQTALGVARVNLRVVAAGKHVLDPF